jgi:hypothetical protein
MRRRTVCIPKGPKDVAEQDPNFIASIIDTKQITARQAWNMIQKVPPATRCGYESRLPHLLHPLYLRNAIAGEAVKPHLDRQAPWSDLLYKTKLNDLPGVQNYAGDPNIPPEV